MKVFAASIKSWRFLFGHLNFPRKVYLQLSLTIIVGSLLQLAFPFLTQAIVDVGIKSGDLGFIYLILFSQLALFFARSAMEWIRSWILLYMSSGTSFRLINDFFVKLLKLSILSISRSSPGDILQRVYDNHRIESFLSSTAIRATFAVFNLIIYSFVVLIYSVKVFSIFLIGSLLYITWIFSFMKKREAINKILFEQYGRNNNKIIEMVNGILDIKQYGAEDKRRRDWAQQRQELYRYNSESMALSQSQNGGAAFINEVKNIMISFVCAKCVIQGEMTLGMMLSLSYIVGQLNISTLDITMFFQSWQDTRLSIDRLIEIHEKFAEDSKPRLYLRKMEKQSDIVIKDIFFSYPNSRSPSLKGLSFKIPFGKVTAIVGASGSGKTTLLKMLLNYLPPQKGSICVGNCDLGELDPNEWKDSCASVLQEGYLFEDTLANNINLNGEAINTERLNAALKASNLLEIVKDTEAASSFRIGRGGEGLSAGQRQRVLIARALYKEADYLFLDEATSSLDTENEKVIIRNIKARFRRKALIIIAHRLSTVQNADQIIVLEKGRISEIGSHADLVESKGKYYELIKNQLELA